MRYESIHDMIGQTPLLKLNHVGVSAPVCLYAKLELANPGGSTKDRIGLSMLKAAQDSGVLQPGGTIVEATAGNTGLGIALATLNCGYDVIFVVPTKFSQEKQALMRALGARVINTPREDGMLGAEATAEQLRTTIPGAVSMAQFRNPANPQAHYQTTGPEIWQDLEGSITAVVAGAGSGGTYTGVLRYLKEQDPAVKGILVDPVGSTMGGGQHADYNIEGIGNDFIPDTMDMTLVDDVVKVTDDEAFQHVKLLAAHEGVIAGSSSGAALAGALRYISQTKPQGNIVTIFPDRGDRYFSTGLWD